MLKCNYVNLHTHSHYSMLDGISKYENYLELLKNTPNQINSFAMTEHGSLMGTISYLNACKEYGAKPIVGVEIYLTTDDELMKFKKDNKKVPKRYHLILLAKNKNGYKQLVQMNNYCVKEKNVYISRIQRSYILHTPSILKKFIKNDIICSAACVGSYIFQPYNFNNDLDTSLLRYKEIKDIFKDDFYFEFQMLDIESQRRMNGLQIKLMDKFPNQKAIVTSDSHYAKKGLGELREITMAMNWKMTLNQFKIVTSKNDNTEEQVNIHFRTNDELYEEWSLNHSDIISEEQFRKACQNTIDIYESIKSFSLDKTQDLDTVKAYFDKDPDEIVKERCIAGLKEKIGNIDNIQVYVDQLKNELKIVKEKNFASYFLAVMTILDNLKKNNQYIGIGRGSASSFLINYLLGITNVDPIEHKLMSERFLDSSRKDYPDIDTDVEDRGIMYQIFQETFPNHDVVLLSNRNTLSVKALIKAVWKTLDIDIPIKNDALDSADKISKYIDDNYNVITLKLEEFLKDKYFNEILTEYQSKNTKIDLLQVLNELYENLSAISVHAGGVVIIDKKENIVPYVPLLGNQMSHYATGFCESASYKELEQIGHIKFDMLGLGNLRCLHKTVEQISKDFNISSEKVYSKIDPKNLDLNIPEIFEGFQRGFTEGIFQFSSEGMTSILKRLKADSIHELTMVNALYRPGPLGSSLHEIVIKNKFANESENIFSDKMLEKIGFILDETYSVPLYEEQIMKIGREIGKFDASQLNRFRKFLKEGQKIIVDNKKLYNKLRKEFYDQFMENGVVQELDRDELEKLWLLMVKFSLYSFNQSHSLNYSLLAYQTMYMSVKFPGYWYTEVLNENPGKLENVMQEIKNRSKLDNLKIKFSPPQLGNFFTDYTFVPEEKGNPYDGTIYIGLRHIKGFGEKAMPQMEQLVGQSFENIDDFLNHIKENKLNAINKTALLAMANIGMFSELGLTREKARAKILIEKDNSFRVEEESTGKRKKWRQMKILEAMKKDKIENDVGKKFFFIAEKEAIGVPFTDNPVSFLKDKIRAIQCKYLNKYCDGGMISSIKKKKTKNGKTYYLLFVESVLKKSNIMIFAWDKVISQMGEEFFTSLQEYDPIVFVGKPNEWKNGTFNLDNIIKVELEDE